MQETVTLTINPSIDTSIQVAQVIAGRKLRGESPRHEPGGGGINVSRALRRLGGQSTLMYTAGGSYGELLRMLLDEEELNHFPISIRGLTRENFVVREASSEQQYRFTVPGPHLEEKEWMHFLARLSTLHPCPKYIVISGSLPEGVPADFYTRAAHLGHELGALVIVDTSGKALQLAAESGVYLLKPNLHELRQMSGKPLEDEAEQEKAVMELVHSRRSENVVLSLGAAGVLLGDSHGCTRVRAPVVPVKSKVGAGDSMVAGIVYALAQDMPLHEAIQYGVAAGAAAVMTPGTELCRKEDTEQLYERLRQEQEA
ncbi:MAG: hexose kinase [Candidatus Omnitrophica bacterium]|nr:hexose kinase [Candidatus Omnitrophota bacterium]